MMRYGIILVGMMCVLALRAGDESSIFEDTVIDKIGSAKGVESVDRLAKTVFEQCRKSATAKKGFGMVTVRSASQHEFPNVKLQLSKAPASIVLQLICETTDLECRDRNNVMICSSVPLTSDLITHFAFQFRYAYDLPEAGKRDIAKYLETWGIKYGPNETIFHDKTTNWLYLAGKPRTVASTFRGMSSLNQTLILQFLRCRFAHVRVKEANLAAAGFGPRTTVIKQSAVQWTKMMDSERIAVMSEGFHYVEEGQEGNLWLDRSIPPAEAKTYAGEFDYLKTSEMHLNLTPRGRYFMKGHLDMQFNTAHDQLGRKPHRDNYRGEPSFFPDFTYVLARDRTVDAKGVSWVEMKLIRTDPANLMKYEFPAPKTHEFEELDVAQRVLGLISKGKAARVRGLLATPVTFSGTGLKAVSDGIRKSSKNGVTISYEAAIEKDRVAVFHMHRKPLKDILHALEEIYPTARFKATLAKETLHIHLQQEIPLLVTKRFTVHPPLRELPDKDSTFFAENLDKLGIPFAKGCRSTYDRKTKVLAVTHSPRYMPVFKRWITDHHLLNLQTLKPTTVRLVQVPTADLKKAMTKEKDTVKAVSALIKAGKAIVKRKMEDGGKSWKAESSKTGQKLNKEWPLPGGRKVGTFYLPDTGYSCSYDVRRNNVLWNESGRWFLKYEMALSHTEITPSKDKHAPWPMVVRSFDIRSPLQLFPGEEKVLTQIRSTTMEPGKDLTYIVLVKGDLLGIDGKKDWELKKTP
jgi:hypothetical protein